MSKKILNSEKMPKAVGPYSLATEINGIIFLSGQLPVDVNTGELEITDTKKATKIIMNNIKTFVEEQGLTMKNILKATIFLTDMKEFPQVNEIYGSFFESDYPARECVQVAALPKGVSVEISAFIAR
ncbi:MAG: Rid family detoxifying hydrolase [Candidatus Muirbacterium halophilum]|nr:Rid family detoxifying hydrolase [Candidatus Muirbacterium halophilum]MCK9475800.1 Rid family detoxifying hydrolase [Candidatus Muirbacterium halophilum]